MKNQNPTKKNTLIIGIIIAIVIIAGIWYFYSKGGNNSSTSQLIPSATDAATIAVGVSVLNILNSVSSINIDANFFSTPTYESLVDYSITVPPQSIGRPNPFAPIGQ